MKSFIRNHPAAGYFSLAFIISWSGVLAVIRGGPIPAPAAEARRLFGLVYLAMLTGPTIAGLTMMAIVGGASGSRDYRARLLRWRVAPIWYMVALLTAPLALALTMLALSQFSGDFVPAFVGAGLIDPAGPIEANDGATLLLLGVAVGLGAGFFEELGWTGFAIPSLRVRHGATAAGLVVGVLWAAWHFLAIWWGSTNAVGSVSVPLYLLVALFSFLPPYRVLMIRVYERTRSLLVAIVMHASLTTSMIILGPPVSGVEALVYDLAFATVLWLIVGASSVVSDRIMIVTERHSMR